MTFHIGDNRGSVGALAEAAFFATGHVGEVRMRSGFLEIADRPKILKTLTWEADLPPDTRIQASTRSGNTFVMRTVYYDRNGKEVSKDTYENLRKSKRGDTVEVVETGDDWSPWSVPYQFSGQRFLSPSPRQFVQLRLNLSSNRPEVAPTLRAVSLDYADAILAGATGEIDPRQAVPGVAQTFTYTLTPMFCSGDPGFDRILVQTPALALRDSLAVRIGGVPIEDFQVSMAQDSLIVQLSAMVQQDQVEIDIHVTVLVNPYLFNAFVGQSSEPDLWQRVVERERHAPTVFVPDVADAVHLIQDISINPAVITPNGDGVGDETRIRFAVFKTDVQAKVEVYSLAGALIQHLHGGTDADGYQVAIWSGQDRSGAFLPSGIYLCRIELDAQAGTLTRVINVASDSPRSDRIWPTMPYGLPYAHSRNPSTLSV